MYKNRLNYKLLNFLILMGLLYICVTNIGTWFNILMSVISVCMPFLIAFVIAYALHPLVNWLQKKGVRKSLAITAVVVGFFLLIALILIISLPLLYNQLVSFSSSIGTVIQDIGAKFNLNLSDLESGVDSYLDNLIHGLGNIIQQGTIDFVGKTVSFLGQAVIITVVTIYFLAYMDKIRTAIKDFLRSTKRKWYQYVKTLDKEFGNYLKGLGLFMIIQFFEYSIVFFLVGHPYWLFFGFLACIASVIPYFGGLVTNLLALLIASTVSMQVFIATLVVCIIFPQIDGYFISPKVYGKTNKVNPLVTIMAVSVGGTLGGFLGIVVALPVYILISASYRFFKNDIKKGVKIVKNQITD